MGLIVSRITIRHMSLVLLRLIEAYHYLWWTGSRAGLLHSTFDDTF